MSFEMEMARTIQRYLRVVKNLDLPIDQILQRPRWKRVWYWWKAREYFDHIPMPDLSLEDVKKIYGD